MTISEAEKIFTGKLEFSNPTHLKARDLLRLKEEYLKLREGIHPVPAPDWTREELSNRIEGMEFIYGEEAL